MIKGTYQNTDVTIYDLSNDKLEKKYTTVINKLGRIGIFQHSIDNDSLPDWFIVYFQVNGYCDVEVFSGNVENRIQSSGKYNVCASTIGLSLPLPDGYAGMVFSGNHELYALPVSCFRVVRLPNSVGGISEPNLSNIPFSIESITPQPVSSNQSIQIRVSAPLMSNYEIALFSYTGNKLFKLKAKNMYEGTQIISIPLSEYNLSKGVYWLTLTVGNQQVQSKLIIN